MFFNEILTPLLLTFLAGISTAIGSLLFLFFRRIRKRYLGFLLGLSAGAMIYISFLELLPSAIADLGFIKANIALFAGVIFIAIIDYLIPHEYIQEKIKVNPGEKQLFSAGLMIAIGIAIHNFPEGIAVFMSSLGSVESGIILALAIAIHNIPEGISVAVPIYFSTNSRRKAFMYSLISGMAEPVGAILGYILLRPFITPTMLSYVFAFVAGIMIFISFDELLPCCFKNGHGGHLSLTGIIIGMIAVAFSLSMF